MPELWEGLVQAVQLIVRLDPEVVEISLRSLYVSAASIVIAALFCVPAGGIIHFHEFRGKKVLINVIQTFYSIPTVVVGLFVFLFISRAGPLGGLELLFTPGAIIIGQVILILPILTGMTISALNGVDKSIKDTALAMGASGSQAIWTIVSEARFAEDTGTLELTQVDGLMAKSQASPQAARSSLRVVLPRRSSRRSSGVTR